MTRLLSLFGLMRVSEHEALNSLYHEMAKQRNDALILEAEAVAKFKKAVADLEKQAGEIAELKECLERKVQAGENMFNWVQGLEAEVAALRPDALAMRRKRQMDRDRRKGRG